MKEESQRQTVFNCSQTIIYAQKRASCFSAYTSANMRFYRSHTIENSEALHADKLAQMHGNLKLRGYEISRICMWRNEGAM